MTNIANRLTMLVASVMRKLLWALRYPTFAPESGPYRVGAIQTRVPGSVACQIHYPADTTTKPPKGFYPYWRPQAVDGLADYSRTSASLLQILSSRSHPCLINAEPLQGSFPLVVFSHGLGGTMEMYTQLCQQIASNGFVVVATEHEDGSGAYAESPLGEPILYKRPDDTPYSRTKVTTFRKPFLQQRVQETIQVLEFLVGNQKAGTDVPIAINPKLERILQACDTQTGVSLLGHSFGGASMILTAQEILKSKTIQLKALGVLDPWAFSLEDSAIQQGIPPSDLPLLTILSEAWLTNPETAQVDQFLQTSAATNSNNVAVKSFFVQNSVHASFADSVSWLPGIVGKKLGLRGKNEGLHQTIPNVAQQCVQHFQQKSSNAIMENLKDYDFYQGQQPQRQQTRVLEES